MKKKPYIIANWKMNLDRSGVERFFSHFTLADELNKVNTVICPSFVYLNEVQSLISDKRIELGGQNLFWENQGAFTGEVAARQLVDVGCKYVMVGHSERRYLFNEDDATINKKIQMALQHKLRPIICLGENFEEKEAGLTKKVVEEKIRNALQDVQLVDMKKVLIAYEPIWAISTNIQNTEGQADSPEQAQVVHKFIRKVIESMYDERIAAQVPVIYGGSIKPENISGFITMEDINGVLVGSASKDGEKFQEIIRAYL